MCAGLVLLANGAAGHKVVDKHGKFWPPKISFNNGFSTKTAEVAQEGGRMDGVKEKRPSGWRYIHTTLIVKMSIVKSPVSK